jgi:DNA-binding MarR family transcriptional regulator
VRDATRLSAFRRWSGAVPTERKLVGMVSELRRLNRTITVPLERDLKRAGCPALESYEVLREIEASGDVHLRPVELQARLAVPQHRMSRLIDGLAKDGYVEREKTASDARGHFVVITDSGRRALQDASSVLSAAMRRFFYRKRRTCGSTPPTGGVRHPQD